MRFQPSFAALGMALAAASCARKTAGPAGGASSCDGVLCTMEYRTLTLAVQNAAGAPLVLDSSYTTDASGIKIDAMYYAGDAMEGRSVLLTDAWAARHKNSTANLIFHGFKNGREVVRQAYTVQTDCCHIRKTAGPDTVAVRL